MAFRFRSFITRGVGISFRNSNTFRNPDVQRTSNTSFSISNVAIVTMLGAFTGLGLEHFGSFIGEKKEENPPKNGRTTPVAVTSTQFVLLFSNLTSKEIDATNTIKEMMTNRDKFPWQDGTTPVEAVFTFLDEMDCDQFNVLFCFHQKLPTPELNYRERTLLMLDRKYGTQNGPMSQLLSALKATPQGDPTGDGSDDPIEKAWATGLFNRITTGGPNGSMAGKIAVNFMDTVPVAASGQTVFDFSGQPSLADEPTQNPFVKILKDAVTSAAQSAAQGLADYLKTLKPSSISAETPDDRQTATVVKGIKDSMPSTGKTVAQLAVFNALGNPEMAKLDRDQQLRVAYTVANSTRAAVESVGNHVADLYQSNSLPTEEELAAIGARGLLDFLKSVGTTVVNGVMQAAPVVLNAVVNSASANNALGGALPPSVALSRAGLHELDTPTKIVLASRIVNGTPNPQASVVTDKAVSDLADRQSNLGAQATLDTFTNTQTASKWRDDDPPQELRNKFRDVALAVANISPTFSNVTDIGATNLVTDTSLKHADALRQNTLEMGIRSCANMIADHKSAEMLYKVHLYRVKIGAEVQPRSFLDFLKTAVPIAANIAKTAAPALLALL